MIHHVFSHTLSSNEYCEPVYQQTCSLELIKKVNRSKLFIGLDVSRYLISKYKTSNRSTHESKYCLLVIYERLNIYFIHILNRCKSVLVLKKSVTCVSVKHNLGKTLNTLTSKKPDISG